MTTFWGVLQKSDAPKPSAESVDILDDKGGEFYVKSFDGFAIEGTILTQAAQLRDALRADNVKFDEAGIWFLSYDPPTRLTGRHNEVLFAKDPQKFAAFYASLKKASDTLSEAVQAA